MADEHDRQEGATTGGAAKGGSAQEGAATEGAPMESAPTRDQPSEQDRSAIGQRAAYEAELNRITPTEMILQTAVSLLNIGGRRLGLERPSDPGSSPPGSPDAGPPAAGERDLEQVRDAIDGVRALMPILERRMSRELGPLRDAVAQLQFAYAREARAGGDARTGAAQPSPAGDAGPGGDAGSGESAKPADSSAPAGDANGPANGEQPTAPGPAESSGRLWVPGR